VFESKAELEAMDPKDFRQLVRQGKWRKETLVSSGYLQSHVAIVPRDLAFDFLLFCNRNPKPFPVLEVTEPGDYHSKLMAPEADLRTDIPRYYIYEYGKLVRESDDIKDYWRDDLVCFLIGCARRIDLIFNAARVEYRKVGSFSSNIQCLPSGSFRGHQVVQCYLFKDTHSVLRAIQISSRFPAMHGSPVHIGNPAVIGISDLCHPEQPPVLIPPKETNEIALFWACAASLHTMVKESKPPLMITNAPGHMLVTDRLEEELAQI
jgi:uncharacterized protein YcsI (UPF0317 family)